MWENMMTTEELKERIEKTNKKIARKEATIAKKQGWIDSGKKEEYEVRYLQEDIRRLGREIIESKKTLEKYEKQLSGELERERMLNDLPEPMKVMQRELAKEWTECFDNPPFVFPCSLMKKITHIVVIRIIRSMV